MDKKEYKRAYYQEHKEQLKEYYRNWIEKKKNDPEYVERQRQRAHDRYHNNPEYRKQVLQYVQDKFHNDPEYKKRHRQHIQDKYHNDPAFRGYRLFHSYKRLDIKKNVAPADPSEYPTQEEVNEMLLQPCVFCGESDWYKIGLDRKDNRFGHIRGNLQPCCKRCNDKKRELSNEEFRQAIAEGRIKLKAMKVVKTDADTAAIPAMPIMRSLLV